MRCTLWVSAAFSLGAVLLFAAPSSPMAQLAGLPLPVPRIYSWLVAVFVALFGGAYAWLARAPIISRPLVGLAAIGKTGVFLLVLVCWLIGEGPGRGVLIACGDLAFAAIFSWWLLGSSTVAQQGAPADVLASRARG